MQVPLINVKGSGKIPLGKFLKAHRRTSQNTLARHLDEKSQPYTVVKPERQLGAPWMDDFISKRKSISLCIDCKRRYGNIWGKFNYIPNTRYPEITDCDGCSKKMELCTGLYAVESNTGKLLLKLK